MPWTLHRLRDTEVWARVGDDGALVADKDGRVDIVYKPMTGAKVYRASARNLQSKGGDPIDIEVGPRAESPQSAPPADAVQVWTDGACSGNPGPAGLGVVIVDGDSRQELSEYLGEATNQVAELAAIEHGLLAIEDRARPVVVYSDSAYAIGLLTKPWKAKANVELVDRLRTLARGFPNLRFVKVAGHAGVAENERCDQLAVEAVRRRAAAHAPGERLTTSPSRPPRSTGPDLPSAPMSSPDAPGRRR